MEMAMAQEKQAKEIRSLIQQEFALVRAELAMRMPHAPEERLERSGDEHVARRVRVRRGLGLVLGRRRRARNHRAPEAEARPDAAVKCGAAASGPS